MSNNSKTLFKLVTATTAILFSITSIVSCRKSEEPATQKPEKKTPPIVTTQKIERKEPDAKTQKEADIGTKLIRARTEKRSFFDGEIIKAENNYKKFDPSRPQIDPTVKAEPAREFALATWQYLKNEESKLGKLSKADRVNEINQTNIALAKAKSGLKNAEKRYNEVKDLDNEKRAQALKENPFYGLAPNPFQTQTPDNKAVAPRSR